MRLYVNRLRKEYNISKESTSRDYEAVPEAPLGKQMQVDFGKTEQLNPNRERVKLRFIS